MSNQCGLQELIEEILRNRSSSSRSLMRFECMRIASFRNFPNGLLVSTLRLARAGLYYTGYGSECRCYFCGFVNGDWSSGNTRSHCDHSLEHSTSNVPISRVDPTEMQLSRGIIVVQVQEEDQSGTPEVSGFRPLQTRRNEDSTMNNTPVDISRSVLQNSNVNRYMDRLSTFTYWPRQISQQPEELAAAGFSYTGRGDRVQCSFCGGQLHEWERTDIPFHEHLRWFPQCPFIKECFQQPSRTVSTNVPSAINPLVIRKVLQYGIQQTDIEKAVGELSRRMCTEEITALEILKFLYQKDPETEDFHHSYVGRCVICAIEPRGTLFLPCTHICCCRRCGQRCCLCPLCRARVKARICVYIP